MIAAPPTIQNVVEKATGIMTTQWLKWLLDWVRDYNLTGTRKDVTFDAANFDGNALMTWVLTAPDQLTFAYTQNGTAVLVALTVDSTTVGGTPDTELRVTLPNGWTLAKTVWGSGWASDNGGALESVIVQGISGDAFLRVTLVGGGNWSASTNATAVAFTMPLWVAA